MTFAVRNHWGGGSVSLNLTISSNTSNYNVFTAAGSPGSVANVTVTVNSGIFVAGNFANAALNTGSGWAVGSTVTLINNGTIVGNAGSGGNPTAANQSNGNPGTAGNTAITAQIPMFITNNNVIAGGGGGGGSGATIYAPNSGGTVNNFGGNGSGGTGSTGTGSSGNNGTGDGPSPTSGANSPGGAGGTPGAHGQRFGSDGLQEAYWNTSTVSQTEGGAGGGGGGWGGWGSDGQQARYNPTTYTGGNGGAGGAVVTGSSNITWVVPGLRYGRIDATSHQYFGGTMSGTRASPTAATMRLFFNSDGTISEAGLNPGAVYTPPVPSWWYGPQTTGIGSSYWIRATLTGGTTPTLGTMGSWTSLSSNQEWRVDSLTSPSTKNSVILFEISTSSGGSPIVASGTFDITATAT